MKPIERGESMKHRVRRSDRRLIPEFQKERRERGTGNRCPEIRNPWSTEVQPSPRKTHEKKSTARRVKS